MKYAERHLQSAVNIIEAYNGKVPLHHFLKSFFAADKKFGSKDRRSISHLCYSYCRLGHALLEISAEQRIVIVLFLSAADEWVILFPPEWQAAEGKNFPERLALVQERYPAFSVVDIFPFQPISSDIELEAFSLSHLYQPKLFIRVRPGKEAIVQQKLSAANVQYNLVNDHCFSFKNNTKLEALLEPNSEYVVQDLNSQRVGELMRIVDCKALRVWDCCAASGGKSIMAYDLLKIEKLLVTDIRTTIIANLRNRFAEAGIHNYHSLVADASSADELVKIIGTQKFDLIICDAPCTGSGTWGRTPEQLFYFNESDVMRYASLQRKIASNAVRYLQKGSYFLYITCSVFEAENEAVVHYLKEKFKLEIIKADLIKGYDQHADTMFAALLKV